MAAAYALAASKVGVSTVTCGPGLTQLGTALVSAVRRRAPVVVFAGDTSADTYSNQEFDQEPFVKATGAAFVGITAASHVESKVLESFYIARTQSRPVVLSVPIDVQEQAYERSWLYKPSDALLPKPQRILPDPQIVDEAAAVLRSAHRPVIIAGEGAVKSGARDALMALGDRVGCLLATSLRAKNWFEGHPFNLGLAGAFSTDIAHRLLAEADVVLAVGAGLGYFTTEGGHLFPAARVLQIDTAPAGLKETVRTADLHIVSDAKSGVEAITAALDAAGYQATGYRRTEVRHHIERDRPNEPDSYDVATGFQPYTAIRVLDAAVPANWRFVIGVGHFWSFPIMYLRGRDPSSYYVAHDFGAISQALPAAIGHSVGDRSRPVVAIEGDGSLLMNLQELETVARHQIPILIVVMNDGAYGAEVHKLRAKGLNAGEATFGFTNFAAIASAMGLDSVCAREPEQITDAVRKFGAEPKPRLVDVRLDPTSVSAQFRRLYLGEA
jgi:thiamine pyrophosphate-dependent acetolactate synthase large subunit-like protein